MSRHPEPAPDQPVLVIGAAGLDMVGILKDVENPTGPSPANIRVSYGGVARNVAENLARLGQPVNLLTAVGQDTVGELLLAHTRGCGVNVSPSLQVKKTATSSYMAVYGSEGARQVALDDMRVLAEITPEYLKRQAGLFQESAMVFVDANLAPDSLQAVFDLAETAKVPVCADTTSISVAAKLEEHLERIYLLTANSAEASVINSDTPEITGRFSGLQAVRQLVNRGVEFAVIPLAHFGVCYATSETSGHIPAVRTRVVDPTGAGDALTATLIFGLMNHIPFDESVRLGVTAASLILRYPGTIFPGLTLEKLYDELVI